MRYTLLSALMLIYFLPARAQYCNNTSYPVGLEVIYDPVEDYIPSGWPLDKVEKHDFKDASCVLLTKQITREYGKYPAALREKLKLKLIWFSELRVAAVDYYCTYNTRLEAVYLKSYTKNHFYTRQMFHHELSSILMAKYGGLDFETQFRANNPDDFRYFDEEGGGRNAISTDQDSEKFEKEMNEQGFLNQYGMSHWENDFNEIAQNLFLPKREFWNLYDQFPKIRAKVNTVISLYSKIDPALNLDYFQSLAR